MEDLEKLILTVLPNCQLPTLLLALESIGVSSVDDLGFVEPNDLDGVLKKVETRKLLAHARQSLLNQSESDSSGSVMYSTSPSSSSTSQMTPRRTPLDRASTWSVALSENTFSSPENSQAVAGCSTYTNADLSVESLTPSNSNSTVQHSVLDNDWHFNFTIPWNNMPSHIKDTLKMEERPSARDRREVIRLVAAEILAVCQNPKKKHLNEIARKMVLAYPKSFKDVIECDVVGSGYDSLAKQLQCRVDNYQRTQPMIALSGVAEKSRRRKTDYGCVSSDPVPGNLEVQQKKKEELKKMFENNDQDKKKIEMLMLDTFASQRRDVVDEKDTQTMKEEWPYLFDTTGLKTHFIKLTGVQMDEEFYETMTSKFERILHFFKCQVREKGSHAAELLHDIHSANTSKDTSGAVLMLLLHFKEEESHMFVHVEDTCVSSEVRQENLPSTPCIVVCGDSPLTATGFMVAIDQVVVMERIPTLTNAVVNMFMMYYVMNIDYPAGICTTLEFLQRCIFRINPDHGTKVEKKGKRKRLAVNPRVLSLISKISEYDWME